MTLDPLDAATQALRDASADAGDVHAMPRGRDAAVARIAEALRARAKAKKRRRTYAVLAAAAAVALVAGGAAVAAKRGGAVVASGATTTTKDLGRIVDPSGAVTVVRDGRTEAVAQGARVAVGAELRTPAASEAHLDFDNGSRVTLGGSSRMRLVEQSQRKRFALESGAFHAKVAKLAPDERFVVATPDAEIEVRGTAFRVTIVPPDPSCEGGTPTRLVVDEGVVVVRHGGSERRVAAGERWPACAAASSVNASANGSPEPEANAKAAARAAADAPAKNDAKSENNEKSEKNEKNDPKAAHPAHATAEASSHLAEQNDLFDAALHAKRSGDLAGALAKLDRLRAAYPTGPLSENAEVERMRILAAMDKARGAQAAREYLRRRPAGFARAEAEALSTASP